MQTPIEPEAGSVNQEEEVYQNAISYEEELFEQPNEAFFQNESPFQEFAGVGVLHRCPPWGSRGATGPFPGAAPPPAPRDRRSTARSPLDRLHPPPNSGPVPARY